MEDSSGTDRDERGDAAGDETPRWVKVFAAVALIVVALVVVLLVTGNHGPGRHSSSDESYQAVPIFADAQR